MNAISDSATLSPLARWNRVADRSSAWISDAVLSLGARVALGAIFFMSGRTKVDGFLTVTDGTYALFRDEYKVPLLPPELAAHLATYAEHLLPVLLVLGLFTRLGALGVLGMTLVIQLFVRGGGPVSVDRALGIR